MMMREYDNALVFVEVRARASTAYGGAAAGVTRGKQQLVIRAAQYYLLRLPVLPPCRSDALAINGEAIEWWPVAFDAGS